MTKKRILYSVTALLFAFLLAQCSLYKTIMNVSRLKFKLNGVQNVYVAGVSLEGKRNIQDFSLLEIASITASVTKGRLPIDFVLNVAAVNPNDGKGGYARTDATIKAFPYRFVLDAKEILRGNIASPVSIPGTGEESVIPLTIGFDLIQSFRDNNYKSLLNLALNLSGNSSSPSNLEVYATPTISTVLGDITYPGELKIVEKQFSDK